MFYAVRWLPLLAAPRGSDVRKSWPRQRCSAPVDLPMAPCVESVHLFFGLPLFLQLSIFPSVTAISLACSRAVPSRTLPLVFLLSPVSIFLSFFLCLFLLSDFLVSVHRSSGSQSIKLNSFLCGLLFYQDVIYILF